MSFIHSYHFWRRPGYLIFTSFYKGTCKNLLIELDKQNLSPSKLGQAMNMDVRQLFNKSMTINQKLIKLNDIELTTGLNKKPY